MKGTRRRTNLPDMDSIGRSLQNCSLSTTATGAAAASETGDSHGALELNSHLRLPHFWEQCLDLNTGEVYYINWRTGVKSREDPRMTMRSSNFVDARLAAEESILQEQGYVGGEESSYSDDEEDDDDDDDDDEESSSPSSSSSTTTNSRAPAAHYYSENESSGSSSNNNGGGGGGGRREEVLVVAGCKACFMYLMVPKQDVECPKCYGQLIHFDRSDSDT